VPTSLIGRGLGWETGFTMPSKSIEARSSSVTYTAETKLAKKNLPDQIVDLFLALIFMGELKVGDRLPPELELTKILKVNQSSLRMAMRVLSRMKVVESTRGSGLIVLDYKLESGPNFYTDLVQIPELYLGSDFLLDLLDQAPYFFGLLMQSVIADMPPQTSLGYLVALDTQIDYLKSKKTAKEIAEIDIKGQGKASLKIVNPMLQSIFNSFRPLRAYLMEIYYSIDGDHLAHVTAQKTIWIALIEQRISHEEYINEYLRLLNDEVEVLRAHLKTQPASPRLKQSPLKHFPDLTSLK
jgi:GntR family transcriptional regulator, transcriptional repressor for pyruvate dehydrogenase complex